tara:strand:- start:1122 stop:2306 length:1185 start_codon:yes stop_codon:yes gene_type:complete
MANIPIWPGSSSFASVQNPTPFGFYDDDDDFREEADRIAVYSVQRLGYPLVDIELQDVNFYTCFEEAVSEYGAQLYTFQIINNLGNIMGSPTGSALNQISNPGTSNNTYNQASDYGDPYSAEMKIYSGSLQVTSGQQYYDLRTTPSSSIYTGSIAEEVTVKKIYHYAPAAINRYFDPYAGTGTGIQSLMQSFGFGNYSPGVNFMLMPMYFDVLKLQAIEMNDQIRKSAYHFDLNANRYLRLFPIPTSNYTLWFDYTVNPGQQSAASSSLDPLNPTALSTSNVTDLSNAPYENPTYKYLNSPAKQWIRKYALALSKEMLGSIRGKYQTIPIPGAETTLDYTRLLSEAEAEKTSLIEQLRTDLESNTRLSQLTRSNDESDAQQNYLSKVPYQIYVG